MLGKIEKQNVGLFPFIRTGLVYATYSYDVSGSSGGEFETSYEGDVSSFSGDYRIGADYRFSEKFGVTVATSFGGFGGGINYQF